MIGCKVLERAKKSQSVPRHGIQGSETKKTRAGKVFVTTRQTTISYIIRRIKNRYRYPVPRHGSQLLIAKNKLE